jgi:hypothetical protein
MDRIKSISAAYGKLQPAQYQIVARLLNGEDVRYYSKGVNPTSALSLMSRRVIDCEGATCRLRLLPPEQAVTPPSYLSRRRR